MNEQDITLLNNYFNGLLPAGEARAVEARAAEDAGFGQEFALRQAMEDFPRREARRRDLAGTLKNIEEGFFTGEVSASDPRQAPAEPAMTARFGRRRLLAIAASLALVAVAIWFFAVPGSPAYQDYNRHAPLALVERGATEQSASEAETAFNRQDYAAAAAALDRVLAGQPDNLTARLYKGICLLELDRTVEARAAFQPLAEGNSALQPEATWYTALSYLKDKNHPACATELQKIPAGDPRYAPAQELLKVLK